MQPIIYVDLRCLQDICYQLRGIGFHTSALLRARKESRFAKTKTIGLVDGTLPALPTQFEDLVDELSYSLNPCVSGSQSLFIDGSPMTHDTRFDLRFRNHPALLRAAVLYDYIPLDWPGYLPTTSKRIEYFSKLSRLRTFDLFFPISEYTAWRTTELLGVNPDRIIVTGACVRRSLYDARDRMAPPRSPYDHKEPYFVTLGGDDRRKNTEAPVKAVRQLNLLYSRRIPLKVLGHYGVSYKAELLRLAGHAEGAGFLEFYPNISDGELVSLHAEAVASIAPSHIEGFSLPVTEAAVCGCPVVASTCAAQMELVQRPEALFASDDILSLSEKLDQLLHQPVLRASLVESQAHLSSKFHEARVGARLWDSLPAKLAATASRTASSRSPKPSLAFLSPYPPERTDAALRTAMVMHLNQDLFRSDVYTDSPKPLDFGGRYRDAGPVSKALLLDGSYNAVISVLDDSSCRAKILDVFRRYGGPCILYGDSRKPDEMAEIARRASPLIVQTPSQKLLFHKHYGVDAQVAPA